MAEALPPGYRLVDRYKLTEPGNPFSDFEADRDDPGNAFKERFVEHIETGDLYLWAEDKWHNVPNVVRMKCFVISYGILMYLPFKIFRDTVATIKSVGTNLYNGRGVEALKDVGMYFVDRITDPYFAVTIMLIAVFGIIFPYQARSEIGKIERVWHHVDLGRLQPHEYAGRWCTHANHPWDREYPFYLAGCFQIRGNRAERRYHLIEVGADVQPVRGLYQAFFSCTC